MIRVQSLQLSAFCHATEDLQKVCRCFNTFLPVELKESVKPTVRTVRGHHGNPIEMVQLSLKGEEARSSALKIFSGLEDKELQRLLVTLPDMFEGSKLFLRFSKHSAFKGLQNLTSGGDAVKVIIGFSGYLKSKNYVEVLTEAGLIG